MMIQEIEITARTPTAAPMAHIAIDDTEYQIIGSRWSVTVLCGAWIRQRRALGKTFFNADDLQKHYKRHGAQLVEYANRLTAWNGEAI